MRFLVHNYIKLYKLTFYFRATIFKQAPSLIGLAVQGNHRCCYNSNNGHHTAVPPGAIRAAWSLPLEVLFLPQPWSPHSIIPIREAIHFNRG